MSGTLNAKVRGFALGFAATMFASGVEPVAAQSTAPTPQPAAPAGPQSGASNYSLPQTSAAPDAQLAEMLSLYEEICLRNFPDDAAVETVMSARHATTLSPREVRIYLHDDPGEGWTIDGTTARFTVTIEHPPYHACGVRTLAPTGFANMQPYEDLIAGRVNGRTVQRVGPMEGDVGNVHTRGGGEQIVNANGDTEAFLVFETHPNVAPQNGERLGTEVRLVRQFHTQ